MHGRPLLEVRGQLPAVSWSAAVMRTCAMGRHARRVLLTPAAGARHEEVLGPVHPNARDAAVVGALTVSENTVKTHLRKLFSALGAASRSHAVALAWQHGFLP